MHPGIDYVIHAALKVETFTHRGLGMRPSCSGQLSYHPISSETKREPGPCLPRRGGRYELETSTFRLYNRAKHANMFACAKVLA